MIFRDKITKFILNIGTIPACFCDFLIHFCPDCHSLMPDCWVLATKKCANTDALRCSDRIMSALFLVELLYLLYHILDLLVHLQEVGVQQTLPFLCGLELIELGEWVF